MDFESTKLWFTAPFFARFSCCRMFFDAVEHSGENIGSPVPSVFLVWFKG